MIKKYSSLTLAFLLVMLVIIIGYPLIFPKNIMVTVPFDGTLYPADMAPPLFSWKDSTGSDNWKIIFKSVDNKEILRRTSLAVDWIPEPDDWNILKENSLEKDLTVHIKGYKKLLGIELRKSEVSFKIKTSSDPVSAPIFFRSVTLPFEFANQHMDTIKWCIGDISSGKSPRVVLENMPVCGNCHSFTSNGATLGMDVDYANDKGSYVITSIRDEMYLEKEDVITWSEYKRDEKEMTFGLLSSLSPDGRYAISTVKDRSVFVPKDDLYISQLFFPLKGILAYYDRETKKFNALPGADDKKYVQSNSVWSPDGKYIVFAKAPADTMKKYGDKVVLTKAECDEYLIGGKKFKYDLYRVPFNDGKGGEAVPIEGASGDEMSNYFPKYSPDGKWIVFCKAESFMLLQPDSKLYIIPAEGGNARLMNCNREMLNSWHSWSPNSKWLVFSSKALSPYTQLFLTHIDENGNDTPPVLLSSFIFPERAVNIPEFINNSPDCIAKINQEFMDDYSYFRAGLFSEDYFKDTEKAEKDYLTALSINPKNAQAHLSLGRIYLGKNDYQRAEKEFLEALKINPSDVYSHNKLGEIYKTTEKFDLAEREFKAALKLTPDNYYAFHNLGYAYMKAKSYKEAEKVFSQLINLVTEKMKTNADVVTSATSKNFIARAYAGLGNSLTVQGKYEEAIPEFQLVINLEPDNDLAHKSLGDVYFNTGKVDLALKEYELALNLNPSNDTLKRNIQKIKQMSSR